MRHSPPAPGRYPQGSQAHRGLAAQSAGLTETNEIRHVMLRTLGEQGLYIEARQVKAMLKESTNVVFGGERFGPTRKGPKPFVAERVFVEPDRLWLGAREPHGVEMTIGHLIGPTGPRSIVGYHEYVQDATLEFRVLTMRDCLSPEQWADLWVHAQENGLGALRSQGFGRFFLEQWDRIQ